MITLAPLNPAAAALPADGEIIGDQPMRQPRWPAYAIKFHLRLPTAIGTGVSALRAAAPTAILVTPMQRRLVTDPP